MQYMKLDPSQREALMASLVDMPEYLKSAFADLSPQQMRTPGLDGTPSPVEQVWHLADLEREGFAVRIRRLLNEPDPELPDFDGARVAAERNYRSRSLEEGLAQFGEARRHNVDTLRALQPGSWYLSGTQEGVGAVSLCDIPSFMWQHDSAHRAEIDEWRRSANHQTGC